MWLVVSRDGDKQHILAAGRFYFAAVDDAATVGQQDDFDKHSGVESRCAFYVILVACMEGGKIELVINKVAQRVFKTARNDLPVKVDRQQF